MRATITLFDRYEISVCAEGPNTHRWGERWIGSRQLLHIDVNLWVKPEREIHG